MNSQKFTNNLVFLLSLLFVNHGIQAQGIQQEVIYSSTYGNGQDFGYLEYLPIGYDVESSNFPVLISLHGLGERADGNTIQFWKIKGYNQVAKLIEAGKHFPFIVISPQQPKNVDGRYSGRSSWDANIIDEVLERVKKLRRVDTDRIYITGTSMGGGGVWSYLKAHGDKIAAAAPICGTRTINSTDAATSKVKDTPIWAFHNHGDNIVNAGNTENIINWINAASPATEPLKTIFSWSGHNAWDRVYSFITDLNQYKLCTDHANNYSYGPNTEKAIIYDWFLTHSLNGSEPPAPSNIAPVAKAGSDQSITLPTNQVTLNDGNSSDSDGSIVSYQWSKVSGPPTFSFSSASSKSTYAKNLVQGTYVFRLTVKDDGGATATDNVEITVLENQPPVIEIAKNVTLVLPMDSTILLPKVEDADGTITSVKCSQLSGPNKAQIMVQSTESIVVDSLLEGQYTFQITAEDNLGASSSDSVMIEVISEPSSSPAAPDEQYAAGLQYNYYEGNWDMVPNFPVQTAIKSGEIADFSLSPRLKDVNFAFNFEGYIHLETEGTYTFYTASDDGSKLYIDEVEVVNNDGLHAKQERSGHVYLTAGYHKIQVAFFEKWGSEVLEVQYEGPGIPKQAIPSGVLFHHTEAASDENELAGLNYSYYEGNWDMVPNFPVLTAIKSGEIANFSLSPRLKDVNFAFNFEGYIHLETEGTYTFYTASDDGSKLYIDEAEVVNNDGLHAKQERSGHVYLTAGYHKIQVAFFEKWGSEVLEVKYEGPGIPNQAIPSEVLFKDVEGSNMREEFQSKAVISDLDLENNTIGTATIIKTFPNPVQDVLHVSLDKERSVRLLFVDYFGNTIHTLESSRNQFISVDLTEIDIAVGGFVVTVVDTDNKELVLSKKMMRLK